MIVVSGTLQVHPDLREEAIEIVLKLAKASEAEKGCLLYRFYADLEDPNTFFMFEKWENEAALEAHFETPHIAEFRQHLPRLLAGERKIYSYEVSNMSQL